MEELTHVYEEFDQLDAIVRDYAKQHNGLNKARQHIHAAMKIIQEAAAELAVPEALDLGDLRIVENIGSTLESLDDDCDILGVPLRLDEACSLDFSKHIDAIVSDEGSRAEEAKKHQVLNVAQSNQQEYDRRYKEMPRDRTRFRR